MREIVLKHCEIFEPCQTRKIAPRASGGGGKTANFRQLAPLAIQYASHQNCARTSHRTKLSGQILGAHGSMECEGMAC